MDMLETEQVVEMASLTSPTGSGAGGAIGQSILLGVKYPSVPKIPSGSKNNKKLRKIKK